MARGNALAIFVRLGDPAILKASIERLWGEREKKRPAAITLIWRASVYISLYRFSFALDGNDDCDDAENDQVGSTLTAATSAHINESASAAEWPLPVVSFNCFFCCCCCGGEFNCCVN